MEGDLKRCEPWAWGMCSQLLQPWASVDHMRRSKQQILDHSQKYKAVHTTALYSLYLICTCCSKAPRTHCHTWDHRQDNCCCAVSKIQWSIYWLKKPSLCKCGAVTIKHCVFGQKITTQQSDLLLLTAFKLKLLCPVPNSLFTVLCLSSISIYDRHQFRSTVHIFHCHSNVNKN